MLEKVRSVEMRYTDRSLRQVATTNVRNTHETRAIQDS